LIHTRSQLARPQWQWVGGANLRR